MDSAQKMKRSLRNSLCNGFESVATFNSKNSRPPLYTPFSVASRLRERLRSERQDAADDISATTPSLISSHYEDSIPTKAISEDELSPPPTLEEMLARLDAEEEEEQLLLTGYLPCDYCEGLRGAVPSLLGRGCEHRPHGFSCYNGGFIPRRMSCVNNSEILRAARHALNQYPRFSVDGIEHALQGPSIHAGGRARLDVPRKSYCGEKEIFLGPDLGRNLCYNRHHRQGDPAGAKITGKENGSCTSEGKLLNNRRSSSNARWREPGLIARLMGLEAMPLNNIATSSSNTDHHPMQKSRALSRSGINANISKASATPVKSNAKEQPKLDRRRSMAQQPKAVNSKQDHLKQSTLPGSVSKQQGLPGRQKTYDHIIQGARPFSGAEKTVKIKDKGPGVQRKTVGLQASSSSSSSSSAAANQSRKQQRSCCKASDPTKPNHNVDAKETRRLRNGGIRKHII